MKWHLTAALIAAIGWIGTPAAAQGGKPHGDWPIAVTVQLGTTRGDMVITPRHVVFEKGQQYRLILTNPSDVEHRFSALSFSPLVMTHGKPVIDMGAVIARPRLTARVPSGYVVREIDIAPGGTAVWRFTALSSRIAKIGCKIDSHARAGMTGTFSVL